MFDDQLASVTYFNAFLLSLRNYTKRDAIEIYSKLSLANAQDKYNDVIGDFSV